MKRLLLLLLPAVLLAATPAGFHVWTSDELKSYSEGLKSRMKNGVAAVDLGNGGTLAYAESTGEAVQFEKQAQLLIVRSGRASVRIGGKILDGKTVAPGEIRGTVIETEHVQPLKEGDVMRIPANTPHQVVLETDQKIEYLAIRADSIL